MKTKKRPRCLVCKQPISSENCNKILKKKRKNLSGPKKEASSCGVRRGVEPKGSNGVEQSPPAQNLSEEEALTERMRAKGYNV